MKHTTTKRFTISNKLKRNQFEREKLQAFRSFDKKYNKKWEKWMVRKRRKNTTISYYEYLQQKHICIRRSPLLQNLYGVDPRLPDTEIISHLKNSMSLIFLMHL